MRYQVTEHGWESEIEADSLAAALRAYAEDYPRDGLIETSWPHVFVAGEEYTLTIDPEEPPCSSESCEHHWERPLAVVGGIRENPGISGHGGGVVITEVCRCGLQRTTDTWAQDPQTGEQGLTSVRYDRLTDWEIGDWTDGEAQ